MAVINSAERYRPTAKFRTYLFAIAHRKLVDYWRKTKQDQGVQRVDSRGEPLVEQLESQPRNWTDSVDLSMDLLLALESLSRDQQQAYLLKEEGFSRSEIAVMMEANEETTKSRIRYATAHLRKMLEVQYANR